MLYVLFVCAFDTFNKDYSLSYLIMHLSLSELFSAYFEIVNSC